MKLTRLLTLVFAFALLFNIACTDDNNATNDMYYGGGVLLSNEGNFGKPNADVTFVSSDLNTKQDNIFSANNGSNLGDVLQTIGFSGENAYLLLNNSNKIQVVNRYNFKKVGEITAQLNSPRYIAFANNNIYVTNDKYNGDKYVSVYKASDLSFVKKITFTDNAERIVAAGNYVFVQNASFGFGNKISYISTSTNEVQNTITLPSGNINKMIANNQSVYAIAAGTTDSYIYQISNTGSITKTYTLTGITDATNLEIENGKIYFTSGLKVYTMDVTATTAPTTPLFTVANSVDPYSNLYGFSVVNGRIYTSDANGFTEDSKISVYSTTGSLLKTFTAGKGTNGAYWN
ncbi:YncE family protein [Chryseobacterium sp. MMS23-Vi53]|uniref:YncE family protein n=1 Tax=Chryseobacterium sp. MMS23-Vi53 TaxID=3386644 RepID=UPI0039EC0A11